MLDDHRKNRLMELFAEASELAPEQRGAFFKRVADEDAPVHFELVELLRVAEHDLADFLAEPVIAAPTTRSAPPPEITGYVVLEPIGRGGMSTVYRADQLVPVQRCVAVKTLRTGLDSQQLLARFAAERQALARMAHPNIAAVYDAGADQLGRPWLAMEFVEGVAITDYCEEHGLGVDARVALMARVCDAIDHAHRRGVLHRDLKPSNVLVVHDDHQPIPKLIDFGIAKALEGSLGDESIHTLEGSLLGTPEYMSPEQIAGDGRAVDTRSDVYALGVMLYELLTGERPFDAERLRSAGLTDMLRIVRDEVPPTPSTRLRDRSATTSGDVSTTAQFTLRVRGDLDWVVMKALEKDPDRRYATPRGLGEDLRRFLANLPVEAGPPSRTYRLRKFVRRYRVLVTSALLVLASLVTGLVGVSLLAARNDQLATGERLARAESEDANRLLRLSLYRSQLRLASEAIRTPGGIARTRELLAAWLPQPGEADVRGFEWQLLNACCSTELQVTAAEPYPIALTWAAPDRVVSTHWRSAVSWDRAGKQLARWTTPVDPIAAIACDRAARVLALSTSLKTVQVIDTATGAELTRIEHAEPIYRAVLSGDGSLLLAKSHPMRASLWDARTGAHLADLPGAGNAVMALSDDGRLIAVAAPPGGDEQVTVYRRDELDRAAHVLRAPVSGPWQIDFADDGAKVALACQSGDLCVWSLRDERLLYQLPHTDALRCVAFDPGGKRVAVGCHDYVAYVHTLGRPDVQLLSGHTGIVDALAWSPDGSQLVTLGEDATLRWWDPDSHTARRTRQVDIAREAGHGQLAFVDGGDRLAVHTERSADLLWDLRDDSTQRGFTLASGDPRFVRGERDGPGALPDYRFAALAADGRLALVTASPRTLWLWPTHASAPTACEFPGWARGLAWSVTGHLVTIDASDTLRLFDSTTGAEVASRREPHGPLALAASPVDDLLAVACADQSVWLSSSAGDDRGVLRGHTGHVQAVAFAPDGARLASGARDGTVRLWDVADRAEVACLYGAGIVIAVAFSPDGTRLAALDSTGGLVLWDARPTGRR